MTILVAGLSVLDFVFTVDQMPYKAEKYRAVDLNVTGGGCAANAAVAITRLGGSAALASRLGDDTQGDQILADLVREGVDCRYVERLPGARSSTSAVLVDRSGNRQIVNYRDESLGSGPIQEVGVGIDAVLADTRWASGASAAMKLAQQRGVPSVLDAEEPVSHDAAQMATHVVFSEQGLRSFTDIDDTGPALLAANSKLPGWVAVTTGPTGTLIVEDDRVERIPAPHVIAVDTLAAGDVWHGAFVVALTDGLTEEEAVRFGNAAAALKCASPGGRQGAPNRAAVDRLLKADW